MTARKLCRHCGRQLIPRGASAWDHANGVVYRHQPEPAIARKPKRPPLPRAVRELLRDVVLARSNQVAAYQDLETMPLARTTWPDALMKRAAKILGTTPAAIVARARKAGRR